MMFAVKNTRSVTAPFGWRTFSPLLLLVPACLLSAGCNRGDFAAVEGTATLDGRKLDGGSVRFNPVAGGPVSFGIIAEDGNFHLQTASTQGVVPGKYVATISYRRGHPSMGMSEKEILALEKIPIRYCKQNTSNLQFDVVPGHNSFELKMTSK